MEDVALRVRTWQISVVPGLFQTADYARALAVSGGVWEDPDDIERIVAVRMKRQARLMDDNPLKVHAVIWEPALRQVVGGAEVMREQLSHLYDVAKLPSVHVQVLPFRAGGHPCIGGSFPERHVRAVLRQHGEAQSCPARVLPADRQHRAEDEGMTPFEFVKSSYGTSGGECVEVAVNVTWTVAIRDSKDPGGPMLTFVPAGWTAFRDELAAGGGELTHPQV